MEKICSYCDLKSHRQRTEDIACCYVFSVDSPYYSLCYELFLMFVFLTAQQMLFHMFLHMLHSKKRIFLSAVLLDVVFALPDNTHADTRK